MGHVCCRSDKEEVIPPISKRAEALDKWSLFDVKKPVDTLDSRSKSDISDDTYRHLFKGSNPQSDSRLSEGGDSSAGGLTFAGPQE